MIEIKKENVNENRIKMIVDKKKHKIQDEQDMERKNHDEKKEIKEMKSKKVLLNL